MILTMTGSLQMHGKFEQFLPAGVHMYTGEECAIILYSLWLETAGYQFFIKEPALNLENFRGKKKGASNQVRTQALSFNRRMPRPLHQWASSASI